MIRSDTTFDVIILGSGIAGLSAADELSGRGLRCFIVDVNKPGSGASAAPMLLANPATGRRAKKTWRAEESFRFIENFLERIQQASDKTFFEKNKVLRPALNKKIAADFEKSQEKYNWPSNWLSWVSSEEFKNRYPVFGTSFGGLIVEKAFTINGPDFISFAVNYLQEESVKFLFSTEYSFNKKTDHWEFTFADNGPVTASYLIDASGTDQISSNVWSFIPFHSVKGQTVTFWFDDPLPLNYSISSLGYMAFMSNQPEQLTVGSTYEHSFDDLEPTEDGLERLTKKLTQTLPGFTKKITRTEQWANVRVTVPDKQPVVGPHRNLENYFILGALGSKGMMLGRYAAYLLAEFILNQKKIDPVISTERFF
ncbi:MAG: FAD-binding oxidoreductase [Balneolaceae bacterium]|nr:MAG: FAD-binding oxidoreductase [Balneolaceae bacterium]